MQRCSVTIKDGRWNNANYLLIMDIHNLLVANDLKLERPIKISDKWIHAFAFFIFFYFAVVKKKKKKRRKKRRRRRVTNSVPSQIFGMKVQVVFNLQPFISWCLKVKTALKKWLIISPCTYYLLFAEFPMVTWSKFEYLAISMYL